MYIIVWFRVLDTFIYIYLYIGWVHPVARVTMNVFNKARWNIVANEGVLYSFITFIYSLYIYRM
jgi:hypothetical protein